MFRYVCMQGRDGPKLRRGSLTPRREGRHNKANNAYTNRDFFMVSGGNKNAASASFSTAKLPRPALGDGICHSPFQAPRAGLWLVISIGWIFRLFHATESCRWVFARLVARSDCHCRGPRRSRRNDAQAIRRAGELTPLADSPVCPSAKIYL